MFTEDEQKLLKLNLTGFPLMAAASAAIRGCSTCPHNKVDKRTILRAAAIRLQYNKEFKQFLKKHFKLPVSIAGITFKD